MAVGGPPCDAVMHASVFTVCGGINSFPLAGGMFLNTRAINISHGGNIHRKSDIIVPQ